jgi:hypothetical protein
MRSRLAGCRCRRGSQVYQPARTVAQLHHPGPHRPSREAGDLVQRSLAVLASGTSSSPGSGRARPPRDASRPRGAQPDTPSRPRRCPARSAAHLRRRGRRRPAPRSGHCIRLGIRSGCISLYPPGGSETADGDRLAGHRSCPSRRRCGGPPGTARGGDLDSVISQRKESKSRSAASRSRSPSSAYQHAVPSDRPGAHRHSQRCSVDLQRRCTCSDWTMARTMRPWSVSK